MFSSYLKKTAVERKQREREREEVKTATLANFATKGKESTRVVEVERTKIRMTRIGIVVEFGIAGPLQAPSHSDARQASCCLQKERLAHADGVLVLYQLPPPLC